MKKNKKRKKKKKEKGNVKLLASDTISCKRKNHFHKLVILRLYQEKNDKALEVGEKIGESKK